MSEDKKRKNKIIGISIGILVVLLVVISSTYAYWQITKSQDGSNDIIAACLDIDMQSVDGTFALDPAWPISDSEGMKLEGYTFKVENKCPEDIAYIIGMDSLAVNGENYLNYDSIKVSLDNNDSMIFGKINDKIEHIEANDPYTIRESQKLNTAIVAGNTSNTHNVKVWISSESTLEDQGKVFSGRMFITGGQKIENDKPLVKATPDECFEMDGTEIVGYKEELEKCGTNVTIPAKVNGVAVKTIDTNAFKENTMEVKYYNPYMNPISSPFDKSNVIAAGVLENYNEGDSLDWENLITKMNYGVMYSDDENVYNTLTAALTNTQRFYFDTPTKSDFEGYKEKDLVFYIETLDFDVIGIEYYYMGSKFEVSIDGLDLSQTVNLETIEPRAFTNIETPTSSDEEEYSNFKTSLKSLNFGNNSKSIEIGYGAFSGVDLDELTVYTSYQPKLLSDSLKTAKDNNDWSTLKSENYIVGYFSFSDIDKLIIKPTSTEKVVKSYDGIVEQLYADIKTSELVISDGITSVEQDSFGIRTIALGDDSILTTKISLPNTLLTIGDYAFAGYKFASLTIPSSVTYVGNGAFAYGEANGVITVNNSESATATWHSEWSKTATVQYTK